ncbi:MBL fold metallo-hydrolase [Leptospira idonii]|uniref:MBL fold metallo-hydrolase n=1 Tax=Leptospira idonii TaxID=1193500 RepID=A0A4R9LZY5_9LEPT|nr:MBL fold metallo-hydrolase [Leptospira idonii]TGN19950.1 MBL fold metallo-hydrolase [Leptospira idonii]
MVVQLFGVRGSIAAPLRNQDYRKKILEIIELYSKEPNRTPASAEEFWKSLPYHLKFVTGSDTTCVTVTDDNGELYVLDIGTGARNVGDDLIQEYFKNKQKKDVNFFITHTHWDHIQGLPFFKPIYFPDFTLKFHSPYADLEARLERQQSPEFFPVDFSGTGSAKEFQLFSPGDVLQFSGGLKVECHPLKHPGGSYAYKFTNREGKVFIFATDAEFTGQDMSIIHDYAPFFQGADLLILDTQYTLDESFSKFDWGHTSYTMSVNCATSWNVKNLVLTHHEPSYSDEKIYEIYRAAEQHKELLGEKKLKIHLAREGLRFHL